MLIFVSVCVFVTKVEKVKVTWSVPVTVQRETHSSPVNEGGQVHKTSALSTGAPHPPSTPAPHFFLDSHVQS